MQQDNIQEVRDNLLDLIKTSETPREYLKSSDLKKFYGLITTLPPEERGDFGKKINELKKNLEEAILERESELENATVESLDITAPCDVNSDKPSLLSTELGSQHPLTMNICLER